MEALPMAPIDTEGQFPKQEALNEASCPGSHSAHDTVSQHEDSWNEESFFDESLKSGFGASESIDIKDGNDDNGTALNVDSSSHADFDIDKWDVQSVDESSIKSTSDIKQNKRRRTPSCSLLNRITKSVGSGSGTDSQAQASHLSGSTSIEGEVSYIVVEETDDEYEEKTVSDFMGSSGDYMDLEVTETEKEMTDTEILGVAESETLVDDDLKSTDDAFTLRLPSTSFHGRNSDSVSTLSFAFDELEDTEDLTEHSSIIFVTDCSGSVMTPDSLPMAKTPVSYSQPIKKGRGLSVSMHTQDTTGSTIISSTPTVIMGNLAAVLRPTATQDLEKSNTIISNLTRNINSNRKKGGKHMELSRTFLRPSKRDQRRAITRSNSWGSTKQRQRSTERRDSEKVASARRKSTDMNLSERSIISQNFSQSGRSSLDFSDRTLSSQSLSQIALDCSDQSVISDTLHGSSRFGDCDQSINSQKFSQHGRSIPLGRNNATDLPKVVPVGVSKPSVIARGLPRSSSSSKISASPSRLDCIPDANRRIFSRSMSEKFLGDRENRTASGSSDNRQMVGMERAHLVHMAVGPDNRRMFARANSAKKLVLDDQRQAGSHSRRGIFKIEESKDLLFARSSR